MNICFVLKKIEFRCSMGGDALNVVNMPLPFIVGLTKSGVHNTTFKLVHEVLFGTSINHIYMLS